MRTRTYMTLTALLAVLAWIAGGRVAAAPAGASIAYVAQVQGKATAQTTGSPARTLERFSPLFAGDVLTIDKGGKLMARFTSTGQTQTYLPTDPPARRRVMLPTGPGNDIKSRVLRAVFDDQRAGMAKASRNTQAAVRALSPSEALNALLPRKKTLRRNLTFTWHATAPEPVKITLYDSDDKQVWQMQDVKGDHLAYPADAPRLMPGETYHWTVSQSEAEVSNPAEFTLAAEKAEADAVQRLEALKGVDFADAEEAGLTTAAMLIKSSLYSNALQALAPLTSKNVSPFVHVLRYQAYDAIGLKDEAKAEKDAQGASGDALKAQWMQADTSPLQTEH